MRKFVRWIPSILWMAVIFWLSSRTGNELGSMFPWVERWLPWMDGFNFGHFIAYSILALCLLFAFGNIRFSTKVVVVVLCALYGATDEFHQRFVDSRTPDWLDLRNDTIGAIVAMLVVSIPPFSGWLNRRRLP